MGSEVGQIAWCDLTVDQADRIRDFYKEVVGWESQDVSMGDYSDYCMMSPGDQQAVAGVCHARGVNANLPAQWLMYVTVADIQAAADRCTALGGRLVCPPREMGGQGTFCVMQDPAGAVIALIQPAE